MRKRIIPLALLVSGMAYSQVGIGTLEPNKSAQLEVVAKDKGILIPRVKLQSTTDTSTITNGNVNSLLVFATDTINDIKPGYYYWYIDKWYRVLADGDAVSSTGGGSKVDNFTFDPATGKLTLVQTDPSKPTFEVDLSALRTMQTLTKLGYNPVTNTLTYEDENNDSHVINLEGITRADVAGDNVEFKNGTGTVVFTLPLKNLVRSFETLTELKYNAATSELTYKDEQGQTHIFDMKDIVKANETLTELKYDPALNIFSYKDEAGQTHNIDARTLVQKNETLTVISYDAATNTINYKDEAGTEKPLELKGIVSGELNNTTNNIDFKDGRGTVVYSLPVKDLVEKFESKTTVSEVVYPQGTTKHDGTVTTREERYLVYTKEEKDGSGNPIKEYINITEFVTTLKVEDRNVGGKLEKFLVYTPEKGNPIEIELSAIKLPFNPDKTSPSPLTSTNVEDAINELNKKINNNGVATADITSEKIGTTNEDAIKITNGQDAVLKAVTLGINNGAITTDKIAAGAVTADKLKAADPVAGKSPDEGKVPVVNADGTVTYKKIMGDNIEPKTVTADNLKPEGSEGQVPTIVSDGAGGTKVEYHTPKVDASNVNNKKAITTDGKIVVSANATDAGNTTLADAVLTETYLSIKEGGITTKEIATDAITSDKIKDGEVKTEDLADKAVTASKINPDGAANGAVPTVETDASGNKQVVFKEPAVKADNVTEAKKLATDGKILLNGATNEVSASMLKDVTLSIAQNAITANEIAGGAVTSEKIDNGAVTNDKVATDAITSDKIKNGEVKAEDLATDAVTTDKIANNAVTTDKIGDNQVTTIKINDGAVTKDKIATDAITSDKIVDGTIEGKDIADNTITSDKIQGVDASKITGKADVTSPQNTIEIIGGNGTVLSGVQIDVKQVPADKITGTIDGSKITNESITSDKIQNGTIKGEDIAGNTITNDNIQNVDASKVTNAQALAVKDGLELTGDGSQSLLKGVTIGINAVSGEKITANTLPVDRIKATAADQGKVPTVGADGVVTLEKPTVGADAVKDAKTITSTDITVTGGEGATLKDVTLAIANNAITSDKIQDKTITGVDIADGTITNDNLAGNISSDKITGKDITSEDITITDGTGATLKAVTLAIKDGAITSEKIKDESIEGKDIKDGTIEGKDIANNTITSDKLADNIPADKVTGVALTSNDGSIEITGGDKAVLIATQISVKAVDGSKITNETITSDKIKDGEVKQDDLANNAITSDKIKDGEVKTEDLADNAVTTNKINNGAVTNEKINNGAVTTDKIGDKQVTAEKLADNLPASKIAGEGLTTDGKILLNGTDTEVKAVLTGVRLSIAEGAITAKEIATDAVTSDEIADNAVTTEKIKNGGVTTEKLDGGAVTTEKIGDKQVTAEKLADNIPAGKIQGENLTLGEGLTFGNGANGVGAVLKATEVKIDKIKTSQIDATNQTAGKVLTTKGDGTVEYQDPSVKSDNITDKKTLTTDGIIVIGDAVAGTNSQADALLKDTKLSIKEGGITTKEIANGTITGEDIAAKTITVDKLKGADPAAGATSTDIGKVPTVNADGTVEFKEPTAKADNITEGKALTSTEGTITVTGDGNTALLKGANIEVAKVTTDKLEIPTGADASAEKGKVLTVGDNGKVTLETPSVNAADVKEGKALTGDGSIEVTGGNNAVLVATQITLKEVDGNKIKDDSITSDKIKDGEVKTADIENDAVTNEKIKSVEAGKITDAKTVSTDGKIVIAPNATTVGTNTLAGAVLTDTYLSIANNSIDTDQIANNAITSEKIKDGEVKEGDLADNAVTTDKIKNEAVTPEKLSGNIPASKLVTDKLTVKDGLNVNGTLNGEVANSVLAGVTIGIDAINGEKITANTLPVDRIKATATDQGKVPTVGNDGTVTLQTPSVEAADVKNKANITTDGKISVSSVAGATGQDLAGAVLTATHLSIKPASIEGKDIAQNTITGDNISPKTISVDKINTVGAAEGTVPTVVTNPVTGETELQFKPQATSAGSVVTGQKLSGGTQITVNGGAEAAGAVLVATNLGIAQNAITANEIASGAVTTEKIGDNQVTAEKLAAGIPSNKITGKNLTSEDITVTGGEGATLVETSLSIKANAITAEKIANNAVTTEKINTGAVTTDKIGNNQVTAEKLADNIPASKIEGAALTSSDILVTGGEKSVLVATQLSIKEVDGAKIKAETITSDKIKDGEIKVDDLAKDAVTTDKIATNAVTTDKIGNNQVTTDKLADNAVTTDKIKDDAVTEGKIANNAVTTDKIKDGTVTNDKLAGGISPDKISGNKLHSSDASITVMGDGATTALLKEVDITIASVDGSKIKDGSITSDKIKDGEIKVDDLAKDAVTSEKIADGTIKEEDLSSDIKKSINTDGKIVVGITTNPTETQLQNSVLTETYLAIKEDSIEGKDIKDGTIEGKDIANNTITSDKLADNIPADKVMGVALTSPDSSITIAGEGATALLKATQISIASVDGSKITNNSITTEKIATGAVTTEEIKNGTIKPEDLDPASKIPAANLDTKTLTTDGIIVIGDAGATSQSEAVLKDTKLSIKDGSITSDKIQSVDGSKIADGSITSEKIADGTIKGSDIGATEVKDANIESLNASKITDGQALGVQDGLKIVSGQTEAATALLKGVTLGIESVAADKITGIITENQIAPNAVTTDKIKNEAVTPEKLAGNIPSDKIAGAALTGGTEITVTNGDKAVLVATQLAINEVNGSKITNGTITSDKLGENSVTTEKIANNAVDNTKLATDAVTTDKIKDGQVTNDKLADNISSDKISGKKLHSSDSSITVAGDGATALLKEVDIKVGNISADKITSGTISNDRLNNIPADKIQSQNLTVGEGLEIVGGTNAVLTATTINLKEVPASKIKIGGTNDQVLKPDGNGGVTVGTDKDNQNINLSLDGTKLKVDITGGNGGEVELAQILPTNTDNQNATLSLSGRTLTLNIDRGTGNFVELPSETVTSLTENDGVLTYINENNVSNTITLPKNTDNQQLKNFQLNGTTLSLDIDNGTAPVTVDLSSLKTENTDNQNLTNPVLTDNKLKFGIERGNEVEVDLSSLKTVETVTKLEFAEANRTLTYTDEASKTTVITLPADNDTKYEGSTSVLLEGNKFIRAEFTGDVTASKDSNELTIGEKKVGNTKLDGGTGVDNRVAVSDASGTVTYKPITDVLDKKTLTTDGIIQVGAGTTLANAVLAETSLSIADNSIPSVKLKERKNLVKGDGIEFEGGDGTNAILGDANLTIKAQAENGLNVDTASKKIELGGNLTKATTITQGSHNLTLDASGSGSLTLKGNVDSETIKIEGIKTLERKQVAPEAQQGESANKGTRKMLVVDKENRVQAMKFRKQQFYMPSVTLPTNESTFNQLSQGVSSGWYLFDKASGTFTVNLYAIYQAQFSNTAVSSTTTPMETFKVSELDYYVTYYDGTVFEDLKVTETGVLTYKVKNNGVNASWKTYMNILFQEKWED